MRLGSVRAENGTRVVIAVEGGWLEVGAVLGDADPRAEDIRRLIEEWDQVGPRLEEAVRESLAGRGTELRAADEGRLLPPVPSPRRILCIGRNYREHVAEMGNKPPAAPEVFLRLPSSLVGPRDDIILPQGIEEVDLEVELAVVIGRGGRRIAKEQALGAVFGYTIFNDVSVRSWQYRGTQWTAGKNFDKTAPCGPYLVTRDEIADPAGRGIWSEIDGFEMQRGTTGNFFFDIPTLIAELSSFTTLEAGDLIATGTPSGVGMARKPPRWLRAGEVVRCGVDGIGELQNRCARG